MPDTETFDYVIVGAGSAGCVLANRLTEDEGATVCLLEAGPPDASPLIRMPAGFIRMLFDPVYNYKFMSTPQATLNDRPIYIPRGRTLGGSSSINGMIYIRGHRLDYDDWAAAGNRGWGYDDVLPYFRKSEHNETFTDSDVHGQGGPFNIKYLEKPNKLNHVFMDAAGSLQLARSPDFNTGDNEGFGIFQVTQKDGRRVTAASAFLDPARARSNLKIVTDAQVSKLVIEGGRAMGVDFKTGGETRRVNARREVLLSAGSIASPQILLLSGTGNGETLNKLGIEVQLALPGVGANLQDHISAPIHYKSPKATSYGVSIRAAPRIAWGILQYTLFRKGFLANNIVKLIRGVRDAKRILMSPVFDRYRGDEVTPGTGNDSDEQLRDYIREFSSTVFHPVGTCKMGNDDMAVVDDRLRLRGIEGLRVVDASIMPTITTGNTNAPTLMIAEKAADMIKENALG